MTQRMKKVRQYKGYIIALASNGMYYIYTKEEWAYGEGYRYPEWEDAGSIQECIDWIGGN